MGTSLGITRPSRPGPPQTSQWSCEASALSQKWSLCRIQDDQYFGHIVRGVWGVPCLEKQTLFGLQCLAERSAMPELPQSAANDMAANALAAQTSWVRSPCLSVSPSPSPSLSLPHPSVRRSVCACGIAVWIEAPLLRRSHHHYRGRFMWAICAWGLLRIQARQIRTMSCTAGSLILALAAVV